MITGAETGPSGYKPEKAFTENQSVIVRMALVGGKPKPKMVGQDHQPFFFLLAHWEFRTPYGIAVFEDSDVFVSDWLNATLHRFDTEGNQILQWGERGDQGGQLDNPLGLVVDGDGDVYVVDNNNNRVQKFSADGTFLTMWGNPGVRAGEFRNPIDIAIDPEGFIYVTDADNHRIQKFRPS